MSDTDERIKAEMFCAIFWAVTILLVAAMICITICAIYAPALGGGLSK